MIEKNKTHIALAWYRKDQWDKLLEISIDGDELEQTYEEWVTQANQKIEAMKNKGLNLIRIDVEVNALRSWCEKERRPVDGAARSEYAIVAAQNGENILA